MPYELRCSIRAHSNDVRSLALMDSCIISGSRDKTVKLWTETENGYMQTTVMNRHTHFVSSVCVIPASKAFPDGLICSAGHDNKIMGFVPYTNEPKFTLTGHSGPVCCLSPSLSVDHILSSSWDCTAKDWDIPSGECVKTFFGHSQSVWCIIQMPKGFTVTGSADKLIKVFDDAGNCVRTLEGHTDCVRGLTPCGEDTFLSCANDGCIRKWNVKTGETLHLLLICDNYLYSVAALNSLVVCGGEGNNLTISCIEKNTKEVINLPATSVWAVAILPNSDIVTGASDGYIRIFTEDPTKMASNEMLAEYKNEFAEGRGESGINTDYNFPRKEALAVNGLFHGELKFIFDNGTNYCYSWDEEKGRWSLVGEECRQRPSTSTSNSTATDPWCYYPPKKYVFFENFDLPQIIKKLREFSDQVKSNKSGFVELKKAVEGLVTKEVAESLNMNLQIFMEALENWPELIVFPLLDIARIAALNPIVHPAMFTGENALKLFSSLKRFMVPNALENNKMLVFRILSNAFSGNEGANQVMKVSKTILERLTEVLTTNHKGLEIASSTFMINISLKAMKTTDKHVAELCITSIQRSVGFFMDPEAIFRILVALGTLGIISGPNVIPKDIIPLLEVVSSWKEKDPSILKARKCAQDILNDFVKE